MPVTFKLQNIKAGVMIYIFMDHYTGFLCYNQYKPKTV
jgi:hypothetical protein